MMENVQGGGSETDKGWGIEKHTSVTDTNTDKNM